MAHIVRRITVELVYEDGIDELEGFKNYSPEDVFEWGTIIYDEVEGEPDELPTAG